MADSHQQASRQQIDEQAAEWMIRLHEGDLSEAQRLEFECWKRQGPQYAASAARMQEVIGRMQTLRTRKGPAKAALDAAFADTRKPRRFKQAGRALLLVCCLALPAAALLNSSYPQQWMADISTGPRDWKTVHLQDQSTLTLSGTSAVNLHFDARERRIELLQGEVLVEVAHDPARPFIVQTAQGSLRALGTRFVVRRQQDATVLTMLESRVAAQSANGQQTLEVAAGTQAVIHKDTVQLAGTVDPLSINEAWRRHQLVVENLPLADVLDEIARHRPGHVRFDRAALANLRVSAVLPLNDTDKALQLIAETLPVKVQSFSPWLIVVSLAGVAEK